MAIEKLTAPQKKALQLVADGGVYYSTWDYRYKNADTGKTLVVVERLRSMGLIENQKSKHWRDNRREVVLTDAGREALNALNGVAKPQNVAAQ